MEIFTLALYIVTAILSIFAAYFTFHIYKAYRDTCIGWAVLAAAVMLIAFQRIVALANYTTLFPPLEIFGALSAITHLIIVLLVLIGAWHVKKMTETHTFVEKELVERIKRFEARYDKRVAKQLKKRKQ